MATPTKQVPKPASTPKIVTPVKTIPVPASQPKSVVRPAPSGGTTIRPPKPPTTLSARERIIASGDAHVFLASKAAAAPSVNRVQPVAPARFATKVANANAKVANANANPAAPGQQKKAAGVKSARTFAQQRADYNIAAGKREDAANPKRYAGPLPAKPPSVIDQIGGFLADRVAQVTGSKPSTISRAMGNQTPVIPYTQQNISNIKRATKKYP